MSLPDQPPTFRPPTPDERPWWWQLETSEGAEVDESTLPEEYAGQRFASQGDAESWVGEVFADLTEHGVDQVTLHERDRKVYGPMSLHP